MADAQREKLIELLEDTLHEWECDAQPETLSQIADHLLENGVIVQPCKVGDTVYMPWEWNGTKGIASLEVTHIIIDGLHAYIKTNFYTDDEDYYNAYGCGRFSFDEFGEIVFLNHEEAEKAQKGGAEKCR